ncbi:MAG TPA: hypothetical protein VNG91_01270, partial [Terriglobia bacterium]|nr:hypothetical protein [Terriglobia bacterium]
MDTATEPSQGNVESLLKFSSLGKDVLAEALVAQLDEEAVLLKYLFNLGFCQGFVLASLPDTAKDLLEFVRHRLAH